MNGLSPTLCRLRSMSCVAGLMAMMFLAGANVQAVANELSLRLVDKTLVDTNGKAVRFVRDFIRQGPTVISFTFLGCATSCPAVDLTVDEAVRRYTGGTVRPPNFLTITLDPLNDTPERLAERAQAMEPSRRFLSGEPLDVIAVLDGLGMSFGKVEDHDLFVLVIGQAGRKAERLSGLANSDQITAALERVRK